MRYYFEWDPKKAKQNITKHRISFEQAATVFKDPYAISIFDEEHSEYEDRWITMGRDYGDNLLVVCHTFQILSKDSCKIRIISCRKATKNERRQYEEGL